MTPQLEELTDIHVLANKVYETMFQDTADRDELKARILEAGRHIEEYIAQHDTELLEEVLAKLPSQSKYKTPDSYKKAVRKVIEQYQHKLGEKDGDNT